MLFLVCALPMHLWALLLALKDFSWVADRTNYWDAIGVLSYGMVFAFLESVTIFLAAVLLGFLVSRCWEDGRRIAILSALVLVVALWAIAGQLYFMLELSLPTQVLVSLGQTGHPVRLLYAAGMFLVLPTVLLPAYLVLQSERAYRFVQDLSERLGLLASLYLVLDLACVIVIVLRNM